MIMNYLAERKLRGDEPSAKTVVLLYRTRCFDRWHCELLQFKKNAKENSKQVLLKVGEQKASQNLAAYFFKKYIDNT
jgi:hypothetical protein